MVNARTAIINAALAYRISVVLSPEGAPEPRGFDRGPLGRAGISFRRNAVVFDHDAAPEDMLHELCHLVVGRPSTWLSEGFVLMPFEWELARHLASHLGARERRRFMDGVRAYQDCTEVGRYQLGLEDYGPGVRRMKWWRRGVDRARRLGLLYSNGTPTFLTAMWKGTGINTSRARTWDPGYDERFP